MPVRSPETYTPGTLVEPSSRTSGSFSTVPAGQRVCSQFAYRAIGPAAAIRPPLRGYVRGHGGDVTLLRAQLRHRQLEQPAGHGEPVGGRGADVIDRVDGGLEAPRRL